MYPVIDIPPSSPSLKRTQREANFLSRKEFLSRTERSREIEGNTSPWDRITRRWSWHVLLNSFFDVWEKKEKEVEETKIFGAFVVRSGEICSVPG